MNQPIPLTSNRSRAAVQLSAWLDAVGIPYVIQPVAGDFRVTRADGNQTMVHLVDRGSLRTDPDVYWEDIWDRDLSVVLEAFYGLVEALGYAKTRPIPDRGSDAKEDLTETDYWINHCEFRRAPNPPEEVFQKYNGIVKQRVFKFVMSNWSLCQQLGMDKDDIQQYVLCYLTSFWALFRILRPGDTEKDNEKMLNNLLKQRLALLRKRMLRKVKVAGFEPTDDEVMTQFGEAAADEPAEGPLADLEEHETYRERKKYAAAMLKTVIKKMPPTHAKEKLEKLATAVNQPEEVRKEAQKRLEQLLKSKKHLKGGAGAR